MQVHSVSYHYTKISKHNLKSLGSNIMPVQVRLAAPIKARMDTKSVRALLYSDENGSNCENHICTSFVLV